VRFTTPLIDGRFQRRYQRFFADVELADGSLVVAHVPNTGAMLGAMRPGCPCRLSRHDQPQRRLRYTLEMLRPERVWVGVNTATANALVREAFVSGRIASWQAYDRIEAEVASGPATRFDFVMWQSRPGLCTRAQVRAAALAGVGGLHWVEVKNVSLVDQGVALFPDARSQRAAKHARELAAQVQAGQTAEVVFTVQRADARCWRPADAIDPAYGQTLRQAVAAGVRLSAYRCRVERHGLWLSATPLPVNLALPPPC
jgi:sugar fermentation stimulation protein A